MKETAIVTAAAAAAITSSLTRVEAFDVLPRGRQGCLLSRTNAIACPKEEIKVNAMNNDDSYKLAKQSTTRMQFLHQTTAAIILSHGAVPEASALSTINSDSKSISFKKQLLARLYQRQRDVNDSSSSDDESESDSSEDSDSESENDGFSF